MEMTAHFYQYVSILAIFAIKEPNLPIKGRPGLQRVKATLRHRVVIDHDCAESAFKVTPCPAK